MQERSAERNYTRCNCRTGCRSYFRNCSGCWSALRSGIVSAVIAGLAAVAVSVTALGIATGIAVTFALAEIDIISLNIPCRTIISLAILESAGLHSARDNNHTSLVEILADKFTGLTPGRNVKEIGLALTAVTPAKIAVNSYAEGCYVHTALGGTQLRLTGQTAHDDDVV